MPFLARDNRAAEAFPSHLFAGRGGLQRLAIHEVFRRTMHIMDNNSGGLLGADSAATTKHNHLVTSALKAAACSHRTCGLASLSALEMPEVSSSVFHSAAR